MVDDYLRTARRRTGRENAAGGAGETRRSMHASEIYSQCTIWIVGFSSVEPRGRSIRPRRTRAVESDRLKRDCGLRLVVSLGQTLLGRSNVIAHDVAREKIHGYLRLKTVTSDGLGTLYRCWDPKSTSWCQIEMLVRIRRLSQDPCKLTKSSYPFGGLFGGFSGVGNWAVFGDFHIRCGRLRRIRGVERT